MTLTEGLLIVIVIILTFVLVTKYVGHSDSSAETKTWNCSSDSGEKVSVKLSSHGPSCRCMKCMSPEKMTTVENNEYFTGCGDPTETKRALDCLCDGDDKFAYAANDFGVKGDTYTDYIMKATVEPVVFKNHQEFIKDRQNSVSQNITGRTFALGEIETEDIFWQGIRGRPQGIPGGMCNPLQIPEFSDKNYSTGPKMVWKST